MRTILFAQINVLAHLLVCDDIVAIKIDELKKQIEFYCIPTSLVWVNYHVRTLRRLIKILCRLVATIAKTIWRKTQIGQWFVCPGGILTFAILQTRIKEERIICAKNLHERDFWKVRDEMKISRNIALQGCAYVTIT